jgi:hypothetical protein
MSHPSTDVFIAIFLLIAWGWNLPTDSPLARLLRRGRATILFVGLWHSWSMFAPIPVHVNQRLFAILHFSNGRSARWAPRHIGRSRSFWADFADVRRRKTYDNLFSSRTRVLRTFFCDWLAREFNGQRLPVWSAQWRTGRALSGVACTHTYGGAVFRFLVRRPVVTLLLSWAVTAWEVSFPVALVGPARLLTSYLLLGAMLHAGIAVAMGLNTFFWAFVGAYPAVAYCWCRIHA